MMIRLATGYLGLFFLLCLIGRFIFCLLHTAAAGLAGWVVLIFCILHLITYYSLFLLGDESSTMFFCLHCIFLFCLFQFNLICFAFCYVFFKLCYFFCSAKSTFIHLLELHVWFGFLLLIIIIYHKYVRQYVTGIESQDKL